ncbi:uncharacterized protein LOC103522310 [Diaphorina citri]|uniref:Uncharacterized protein LOC103522310 n=1 Tax=Diaphorina citri TaxID=121845 RepID=A0A1S3DQT0_DIACI|nr:uncharacterized protein LOC103522310 [Diaphorina citri]
MSLSIERLLSKQKKCFKTLSLIEGFLKNGDSVQHTIGRLEGSFEQLANLKGEFEDLHLQILELKGLDDEDQLNVSDEFESRAFDCYNDLKQNLTKLKANLNNIETDQSSVTSQNSQSPSHISQSPCHIRLPPIELPTFEGESDRWLPYKDIFTSLVHNNESLTDVQRLHYLKASLKGEASDLVSSLSTSNNNYDVAWKLLCEQYENTRLIVNNHVKAIVNAPPVNTANYRTYSIFTSEIIKNLKAIEALGVSVHGWDPLLISLLLNKLDLETQRDWEISISSSQELPRVQELLDFLSKRGRVEEMLHSNNFENIGKRDTSKQIRFRNSTGLGNQHLFLSRIA